MQAWHVFVQHKSSVINGEVALFSTVYGYREGKKSYPIICCWTLFADLCPAEADVRRVGERACQVLDRWPSSLTDNLDISGKIDEAKADTTSWQEKQAGDKAEAASLHEPQAND